MDDGAQGHSFVITAEANGGYTVEVMGLPVREFGMTLREARRKAEEAVRRWHVETREGEAAP